jgi:hypothetical protein
MWFKPLEGAMIVHATLQDMEAIEAGLQILNATPPEVRFQADCFDIPGDKIGSNAIPYYLGKFVRMNELKEIAGTDGDSAAKARIWATVLSDSQLTEVREFFAQVRQNGETHETNIATLSGRQCQVQFQLDKRGISDTNLGKLLNPTLDLIPCVNANGETLQITVLPHLVECLGHELSPVVAPESIPALPPGGPTSLNGSIYRATLPPPHWHIWQTISTHTLRMGETLLIALTMDQPARSDSVLLKDGTLVELESSEQIVKRRNVLILLTPRVVLSAE